MGFLAVLCCFVLFCLLFCLFLGGFVEECVIAV